MKCMECNSDLAQGSLFCTSCGASTTNDAPVPGTQGAPNSEAKLAAANLARLRKGWMEAEALCIEIMRADPNNVHAYSLLGDVYRDQNRNSDAAQWYRMALDLKPDSAADKAKLSQAESLAAKQVMARQGAPVGAVQGTQNLLGASPILWIRWLTIVASVFLFGAIALVILKGGQPGRPANRPGPPSSMNGNPGLPGPAFIRPGDSQSSSTGAQIQSRSTQPLTQPNPAPRQTAPQNLPAQGSTQQEAALKEFVGRVANPPLNSTLGAVTIDPRDNHVTLVLISAQAGGGDPEPARVMVLQDALAAAQRVFMASAQFNKVSLAVRLGGAQSGAETVFAGDIDKSAANVQPSATSSELLKVFTNTWWAPGLAPDAGSSQPYVNQP